jgi:hypothetical protein
MFFYPKKELSKFVILEAAKLLIRKEKILLILSPGTIELLN